MANAKYKNNVQRRKAIRLQQNNYKKKNMKAYTFKFHKVHDYDVISKLDNQTNRADYIRNLIRNSK